MAKKQAKRKPPVKIPLDFDAAIGGLLKVDPKKKPVKKKSAKRKTKSKK